MQGSQNMVTQVACMGGPGGQLVLSGARDGTVALYETRSGKQAATFAGGAMVMLHIPTSAAVPVGLSGAFALRTATHSVSACPQVGAATALQPCWSGIRLGLMLLQSLAGALCPCR